MSVLGIRIAGRRAGDGEVKNMKRTTAILLVAMCLVVFLSVGPALAALPLIVGTNAGERITGTKNAEKIRGLGGSDEITDGLGKDLVFGGRGGDNLIGYGGDTSLDRFYGGPGNDIVQSRDVPALKDVVVCGGGTDTVYADQADVGGGGCEQVKVR
jgi:Ca2+-binding RTX toxin-like protein